MRAIELALDDSAERSVRDAWASLDAAGIPSLGAIANATYRPHVSLAVFEDGGPRIADAVRSALTDVVGLPVTLAFVGFFITEESPVFLGVVPTQDLLALHRRVRSAVDDVGGYWPYYEPDSFVPHCTLAMGVADRVAALCALENLDLPIDARVAAAHLVEIPGGRVIDTLA